MSEIPRTIEIAVEPKSKTDQPKLSAALDELEKADAALVRWIDRNHSQAFLTCLDHRHLTNTLHALRTRYSVNANFGTPQVAYREAIGRAADIDYTHKKQSVGAGQFARVKLRLEPLPAGSGFVFEDGIQRTPDYGGAVPLEFIPGVEKGIRSVAASGPFAGFPVIDFKAILLDGAYHDADSSTLTFEIAARAAFREAADRLGIMLLEPIMKIEVVSPEGHVGSVIGDLNSRRCVIHSQEMRGTDTVINASVPIANLFGFDDALSRNTQGRGSSAMWFDRYEPVRPRGGDPDNFPPAVGMRA
ncbi:MAG: hypothetical protein GC155_12545 [Alphaproteobacteria bacterium]|nr:hypothetical protein [Alphaproteobacteria bacterium]